MKFRTRHLFYLTTLISAHFALRSWWLSLRIPAYGGLIPVALAAAVAVYLGWTRRPLLVAAMSAATTAVFSATSIAAEVILGSNATNFLPTDGTNTRYHADLTLNAVSISVIAFSCGIVGAVLALLTRLIHSSIKSRRFLRISWLAVSVAALALLALWVSTLARVTDRNGDRVRPGMHRRQVEAILGPPNPLPDLRRKGEAFWDAYTHAGRRYVGINVTYDRDGRVELVDDHGFWSARPWLYW